MTLLVFQRTFPALLILAYPLLIKLRAEREIFIIPVSKVIVRLFVFWSWGGKRTRSYLYLMSDIQRYLQS